MREFLNKWGVSVIVCSIIVTSITVITKNIVHIKNEHTLVDLQRVQINIQMAQDSIEHQKQVQFYDSLSNKL